MKKLMITLLAVGAVALAGCGGSDDGSAGGGAAADTATAAKPALERLEIVNSVCPIMGTKFDPKKVPDVLYREFKGQGVGFCCGGCPSQWDALSDEQKTEKLAAAMAAK